MARRGSRSRGEKVIDNVFWAGGTTSAFTLAAGSVAVNALVSSAQPFTLLRMRGNLVAFLDGASAPGKAVIIGVGLRMVPEGTGSTVLSAPLTDDEASWIYYSTFVLGYEEMVTDVIDVPGISSFREIIDNKAMRRVKPDTELQFVFENATLATAAAVNIAISCRFLLGN